MPNNDIISMVMLDLHEAYPHAVSLRELQRSHPDIDRRRLNSTLSYLYRRKHLIEHAGWQYWRLKRHTAERMKHDTMDGGGPTRYDHPVRRVYLRRTPAEWEAVIADARAKEAHWKRRVHSYCINLGIIYDDRNVD